MASNEEYISITEDGGLKKKIISHGEGECPNIGSVCKVMIYFLLIFKRLLI